MVTGAVECKRGDLIRFYEVETSDYEKPYSPLKKAMCISRVTSHGRLGRELEAEPCAKFLNRGLFFCNLSEGSSIKTTSVGLSWVRKGAAPGRETGQGNCEILIIRDRHVLA